MTLEDFLREEYPGLSLAQADRLFAARLQTSRQNINRYRTFQRWPSAEMIVRIRDESGFRVRAEDHIPPHLRGPEGARSMTGFFAGLTSEQKKRALAYRGPEAHGDETLQQRHRDSEAVGNLKRTTASENA